MLFIGVSKTQMPGKNSYWRRSKTLFADRCLSTASCVIHWNNGYGCCRMARLESSVALFKDSLGAAFSNRWANPLRREMKEIIIAYTVYFRTWERNTSKLMEQHRFRLRNSREAAPAVRKMEGIFLGAGVEQTWKQLVFGCSWKGCEIMNWMPLLLYEQKCWEKLGILGNSKVDVAFLKASQVLKKSFVGPSSIEGGLLSIHSPLPFVSKSEVIFESFAAASGLYIWSLLCFG